MKQKLKKKKKNISIRNIIIIVSMLMMVVTVSIISNIVFSNWMKSADKTSASLAQDINSEILDQIDEFIYLPDHINAVNVEMVQSGVVDLDNEIEREKFFVGVLKAHQTEIYSSSFGTENGEYYGARRNEHGVIEIMRNNGQTDGHSWYYAVKDDMTAGELVVQAGKFDVRTRDWYKAAKAANRPVFSPIYKHFVMNDMTVSAAHPVYNKDGQLKGVLGTHIILSNINDYLSHIAGNRNAFAIIAEKDTGKLIANSLGMENFTILSDGTFQRHTISELDNTNIKQAYEHYLATAQSDFKIGNEKEGQYIKLTEYQHNGLDWIVLVAIPKNLLMASILDNMKLTFLLIVLSLLLSMLIYYLLTRKLLKPMNVLTEATEKLSSGDLSQRVPIVRNDEIGRISKSFNHMADTIDRLVHGLEETVKQRTAELEFTNTELKESKDQLRLILDSTAEAIYGMDLEGTCTFCNARCLEILGYTNQDELLGYNMHLKIHYSRRDGTKIPLEECEIYKAFLVGKRAHAHHTDDEVFWKADGTSFDVEYYSYPQYRDGKIIGAVVTFMDISERKKKEEQIKYLSDRDSLTGLFNRRCYEDSRKKYDSEEYLPISIIFADVNGLKLTNDVFGHAAGDTLLKKSAEILKRVCRNSDIIARVGGDEFIMLLPHTPASDAEEIIAMVKSELSKEKIDAIKCSMALGYDTKTHPDQDIERTMENAENEMYKEKTLNRKVYSSDIINTIIDTLHERSPKDKKHSETVSALCQRIGQAMNLSETEIKKLKDAGYLHDIGKIVLEDSILKNEGVVTEEKRKELQQHPIIGYRILNLFDDTLDLAEGAYGHHERWDGSGFPKGLKGEEISTLARIIAVAEAYDALTNEALPNAIGKQEALVKIKELAGIRFDPNIVEVFVNMMTDL